MFMRYRGGGIGHKYMRDVEAKYENMSRKRVHGKPLRSTGTTQANEGADNVDEDEDDVAGEADNNTGEGKSERSGSGAANPAVGGEEDDEDDEDDEDYVPSEAGSSDDEDTDSGSEIASDLEYDSHGLADP